MASRLLQEALTKSSRDSYNRIYHNYEQFSKFYFPNQQILPATLESLTMFIAHCFEKNYAAATVSTYISALSYIHKLLGLQDNTQHFIVNKTLNGFKKLRTSNDNRLPITPSILKGLINSLPHTCTSLFMSKLLKAMYLLAFHAFLRVGEITGQLPPKGNNLQLSNIKFTFDNSQLPVAIEIRMSQFKHSSGKHIPVLLVQQNTSQNDLCPVKALWEYLKLRMTNMSSPQPLFSLMDDLPLSRQFFTSQLRLSLSYLGLSWKNYKSHSFRIGAATTAASMNIPEDKIQQMGRWHSKAFKKYVRIPTLNI